MFNNNKDIKFKLAQEIAKQEAGTLLSIKLINRDELVILMDDPSGFIDKFYEIVKQACQNNGKYPVIICKQHEEAYIILPDDQKKVEKIAYIIYCQTQLYIDPKTPEGYLKCCFASIKFSSNNKIAVDKLLAMLSYGINNSFDRTCYYCFEDNPIEVEKLQENNKKLNWLRDSLRNNKAKFMYQPVIDRKTGNISYYECLLRIPDENKQLISVGPIITDAESKGLISLVDFTVLEMAIQELRNDRKITLSVNISNIGVLNKRLLKRAEHLLKKHDVSKRLIIEITETSLNQDYVTTKKFINSLHPLGCRFALDDFGSGFTSFKQLLNLPVDIIKIDGSFIRDILTNDHSKSFVEALITLAEDLGVKTVAEFVENGEIAKFLIDINIGGMQGDFFLPASDSRL
ncbi:MAG: EAL domain-containing protein [Rickettsiaceae bacterium]|nr:EAL domain-containing protein [Rickettsiaceae bacterium]